MNWLPPAIAVVIAGSAVVGIVLSKTVAAVLVVLSGAVLLLFVAAYRLHRLAFPDFPRHYKSLGFLSYHVDVEGEPQPFFLFDIRFQNRTKRNVTLEIDLVMRRHVGEQVLKAGTFMRRTQRIGHTIPTKRPLKIEADDYGEAFLCWMVGDVAASRLKRTSDLGGFELRSEYELVLRLTDLVTGAEEETVLVPSEIGELSRRRTWAWLRKGQSE